MRKTIGCSFLALVGALALPVPNPALAASCHDEIARLQKLLDKGGDVDILDLPETTGATMHHQPTAASIAKAMAESKDKAAALLDQARNEEAGGHPDQCLKTLKPIVFR